MAEIGIMKKLTIGGSTYTIPEYNLPIASSSVLGGIKVGSELSINASTGVLSAANTKVTQAYSTTNSNYPLLFSATAGTSSTSSRGATTAILNNSIYANPSTGNLQVVKLNGVTVGSTPKFTDTLYNATTTTIGSASEGTAIKAYTSLTTGDSVSVSAGSAASLSYTARTVGSASNWSAGTAAKATYSTGVLIIQDGTAPSLTITSTACDDITAWTTNTPTEVTKKTVVISGSTTDIPNISVTSQTVVTEINSI